MPPPPPHTHTYIYKYIHLFFVVVCLSVCLLKIIFDTCLCIDVCIDKVCIHGIVRIWSSYLRENNVCSVAHIYRYKILMF